MSKTLRQSPSYPTGPDSEPYDLIGVGFGPSNLALAVAAQELDPTRRVLFFDRNPSFEWHPGMMLDSSRMQISFLKDLVTLRNPASPYSFLQYTRARGRLERFVNLRQFHPSRLEYQDYLRWVAAALSDQVRFGVAVRRVTPVALPGEDNLAVFRIEVEDTRTGQHSARMARNVVWAAGGTPRVPDGMALGERIFHSSRFLSHLPGRFADLDSAWEFAVVGDGQSAGEIAAELLARYPRAQVHLLVSGYSPRASDSSAFINECFFSTEADRYYRSSDTERAAMRADLRNTNYGVMDAELIDRLYGESYLDEVKGIRRLVLHRYARLAGAHDTGSRIEAAIRDRRTEAASSLSVDGLVLATGYHRRLDPAVFADVLPLLERSESGQPILTRNYRVKARGELACGLYLQGCGEASHGLGDTLLSLLPFRAGEIFGDICAAAISSQPRPQAAIAAPEGGCPAAGEYPPRRHLEHDREKRYAVVERCPFATLISARRGDAEPVATQLPLILDRSRGAHGVLFGHMDRNNPHVEILDGQRVLALFHGPNSYISPRVYRSDQLPTWNSITVHVRGRCRLLTDRRAVVRGLASICEHADRGHDAYRLSPGDPRIDRLLPHIVPLRDRDRRDGWSLQVVAGPQ